MLLNMEGKGGVGVIRGYNSVSRGGQEGHVSKRGRGRGEEV